MLGCFVTKPGIGPTCTIPYQQISSFPTTPRAFLVYQLESSVFFVFSFGNGESSINVHVCKIYVEEFDWSTK